MRSQNANLDRASLEVSRTMEKENENPPIKRTLSSSSIQTICHPNNPTTPHTKPKKNSEP
jgi:hypothetical protein